MLTVLTAFGVCFYGYKRYRHIEERLTNVQAGAFSSFATPLPQWMLTRCSPYRVPQPLSILVLKIAKSKIQA